MAAVIPAAVASAQPSRRSTMAEFATGIVTGSTKVRIAAVDAAAK
jgi:hypothetical protein